MAAAVAAGCGYVRSGTWDDVPENWHRAFQSTKPADVVVVHSRYWRAPHWTYEAGYLFEIQPSAAFREQLFSQNRLRTHFKTRRLRQPTRPCFGECPAWFAPKALQDYEIWVYADEPKSNFMVLIDRATGSHLHGRPPGVRTWNDSVRTDQVARWLPLTLRRGEWTAISDRVDPRPVDDKDPRDQRPVTVEDPRSASRKP